MTKSFWSGTAPASTYPKLSGTIEADVVIVGGGITGLTAAQLLSAAGKRVVVLEALTIGLGTTAHSTGNLHTLVDDYLFKIQKKWGDEVLRGVVSSRQKTTDFIERTISELAIECGFARRNHYLFATEDSQFETMDKERDAAVTAGLEALITEDLPLHFGKRRALKIGNQAQFHPLLYVQGVARSIASANCRIFENSKVIEIDADEKLVTTAEGSVRAEFIIEATHTPKGIHRVHTETAAYREYGIAGKLRDDRYPVGIFWSLEEISHSIRSYEADGVRYLIVIGEMHKVGQHHNDEDYYGKVEAFARSHYDIESIDYRWSGQHYKPDDALPFIGRSMTAKNRFIATGFGTSGLIYGPLSARIIADEILGNENAWANLYRSNRFDPIKSGKDFVKENVNVATELVSGYLKRAEVERLADVAPGEGKIVDIDGHKVAVHRSGDGSLSALSPVCTHMGCLVNWNGHEKSWDCPCHGSRFGIDGQVIEGPAYAPLAVKPIGD